jgi:hypothetical protein
VNDNDPSLDPMGARRGSKSATAAAAIVPQKPGLPIWARALIVFAGLALSAFVHRVQRKRGRGVSRIPQSGLDAQLARQLSQKAPTHDYCDVSALQYSVKAAQCDDAGGIVPEYRWLPPQSSEPLAALFWTSLCGMGALTVSGHSLAGSQLENVDTRKASA